MTLSRALNTRRKPVDWQDGNDQAPKPVRLFVGMLSGDRDLMDRARRLLTREYGSVEDSSDYYPFDATEYYANELGSNIEKHFVSFSSLGHAERLADIKRHTNELEQRIAEDLALAPEQRPVNLDPGYLSMSKVVLASTKDQAHRIYLQRGIYAEVTLQFHGGKWQPWPWTYPDYASGTYNAFFMQMRNKLKEQLSRGSPATQGANKSE